MISGIYLSGEIQKVELMRYLLRITFLIIIMTLTTATASADKYSRAWKKVDKFMKEDLPESAAKEIETALKTRIENQKTAFKDYVPAEMDKLNNPVLVVDGKYVFMCLSNNNDKAKEIIG